MAAFRPTTGVHFKVSWIQDKTHDKNGNISQHDITPIYDQKSGKCYAWIWQNSIRETDNILDDVFIGEHLAEAHLIWGDEIGKSSGWVKDTTFKPNYSFACRVFGKCYLEDYRIANEYIKAKRQLNDN